MATLSNILTWRIPMTEECGRLQSIGSQESNITSNFRSMNLPYLLNCQLLSHVQLFVTLWTVAHQAPLSMGFSRQEYWRELPFPSPGDFPNPGIKSGSPALRADSLLSEPPEKLTMHSVELVSFQDPLSFLESLSYSLKYTLHRGHQDSVRWPLAFLDPQDSPGL